MKTKIPLTAEQQAKVDAMLEHITAECSAVNVEKAFDEMLDESGEVNISGLIFMPSRVLRELDPTAHRCGCNDYADGQDWTEINGETYEDRDIEKAKDEFLDTLRDELKELETGRNETDADETRELARIAQDIHKAEAAIEACEDYQF